MASTETLGLYDLISVNTDHWICDNVIESFGTNVGLVIKKTKQEDGTSIISILFGNGIYDIISGYNDRTGFQPAWCKVLVRGVLDDKMELQSHSKHSR